MTCRRRERPDRAITRISLWAPSTSMGRTAQNVSGVLSDGVTPTVLTAREPFYRIGGDVNFNYRNLNVFGVYVAAHDHNLVPVTASGARESPALLPDRPQHSAADSRRRTTWRFPGR